jgi:hypothetical protein
LHVGKSEAFLIGMVTVAQARTLFYTVYRWRHGSFSSLTAAERLTNANRNTGGSGMACAPRRRRGGARRGARAVEDRQLHHGIEQTQGFVVGDMLLGLGRQKVWQAKRGGCGNLNSRDKWIFCATAA